MRMKLELQQQMTLSIAAQVSNDLRQYLPNAMTYMLKLPV